MRLPWTREKPPCDVARSEVGNLTQIDLFDEPLHVGHEDGEISFSQVLTVIGESTIEAGFLQRREHVQHQLTEFGGLKQSVRL